MVLVILGFMTTMVVPRLVGRLDRINQKFALDATVEQFVLLPRRVMLTGRALELSPDTSAQLLVDGKPALSLDASVRFSVEPALRVSANGACTAAHVTLWFGTAAGAVQRRDYRVLPISCELQAET